MNILIKDSGTSFQAPTKSNKKEKKRQSVLFFLRTKIVFSCAKFAHLQFLTSD